MKLLRSRSNLQLLIEILTNDFGNAWEKVLDRNQLKVKRSRTREHNSSSAQLSSPDDMSGPVTVFKSCNAIVKLLNNYYDNC